MFSMRAISLLLLLLIKLRHWGKPLSLAA